MSATNQDILKKFSTEVFSGETGIPAQDAAGGLLQDWQAKEFIKMLVNQSKLLGMVTKKEVPAGQLAGEIYTIDMSEPGTVQAAEAMEYWDETLGIQTGKRSYHCVKSRSQFEMTYEDTVMTVEEGRFEGTVMDLWRDRLVIDLELLSLQGDKDEYAAGGVPAPGGLVQGAVYPDGGYYAPYGGIHGESPHAGQPSTAMARLLRINDGWLTQLLEPGSGAHIVDLGGDFMTPTIFSKALNKLPQNYLPRAQQAYKYLMSPYLLSDYEDYLMARQDNLGASIVQTGGASLKPKGIQIETIPMLPLNLGEGSDKSCMILCDPKNFYWITARKLQVYRKFIQEKDSWRYTGYQFNDFFIVNPDAIVVVVNIGRNEDFTYTGEAESE